MSRVFISYSHEDRQIAQRVVDALGQAGIEVLVDVFVMRPGTDWTAATQRAVSNADAMLVLISPSSARSSPVADEIATARRESVPLYPVLIKGAESELHDAGLIDEAPFIDLRNNAFNQGLEQLVRLFPPGIVALKPQSQVIDILQQRGFSSDYIRMFDRLLNKQIGRQDDLLVVHFSGDLSLSQAAEYEQLFSSLFVSVIRSELDVYNIFRQKHKPLFDLYSAPTMVRGRALAHPGSTEVFIDIVREFLVTWQSLSEISRNMLVNLASEAVWSAMVRGTFILRQFGVRKSDHNGDRAAQVEVLEVDPELVHEAHISHDSSKIAHEIVRKSLKTEKYLGVRGGRLVYGMEKTETTSTYYHG